MVARRIPVPKVKVSTTLLLNFLFFLLTSLLIELRG